MQSMRKLLAASLVVGGLLALAAPVMADHRVRRGDHREWEARREYHRDWRRDSRRGDIARDQARRDLWRHRHYWRWNHWGRYGPGRDHRYAFPRHRWHRWDRGWHRGWWRR